MGSLSDNGGGWPPDGGMPDGLPKLPPEWGDIVIPDDLSELSAEVAAVRAELHHDQDREQDRTGWQRLRDRLGLHRLRRMGAAGLRGPALIITMAVLVTLASLWASAWPGPARTPTTQRTTNSADSRNLPALELVGIDGQTVPLRGQLPAVILLIDGCDCARLIADTAAAVGPDIAVVTVVSGTAPTAATASGAVDPPTGAAPPPQGNPVVRRLRDPTSELRSTYDLAAPDGNAAVLLVSGTGQIIRRVPRIASVEDIRPYFARL
jgi:hypothetical protein